jgi:hypothetical protein
VLDTPSALAQAAALAPGARIEPCHALRLASGFREFSAIPDLRGRGVLTSRIGYITIFNNILFG